MATRRTKADLLHELDEVRAENHALRGQLEALQAQVEQVTALVAAVVAERDQVRAELRTAQATITTLQQTRQELQTELTTLKQAPFVARRRREAPTGAPRGRPPGHAGSSRMRPTRVDRTQAIPAPEHCPDWHLLHWHWCDA
jgi:chromosome segregation ATPase